MVAVPRGGRADPGQIAACTGFGPGLRPDIVARRHARQKARFLFVGAKFHHRRAEQENAVLIDAQRRTGAVIFFLEDQPADQVKPAPAIGFGPGDHAPATFVELSFPVAMRLEPFAVEIE